MGKYTQIRVIKVTQGLVYVNSGKYRYVRLNMDNNGILGPNRVAKTKLEQIIILPNFVFNQ